MKNIRHYLNSISLSPRELYDKILSYKMSYEQLCESGFPISDPTRPNKVSLCSSFAFSRSKDPAEQFCRCGKSVSLLEKDWYKDDSGCLYHRGKRVYRDGPENGLYSCCKGAFDEDGCEYHEYHVSYYRAVDENVFVKTKRHKSSKSSNIFALDCEMVFTTSGLEVAKVSLVAVQGDVAYHSFIQPSNPILDFNTAFSGIRAEDLSHVNTSLADVQEHLLKFVNRDSILIGHGLENDLLGLHLLHRNIVDTSIVFAHERGFPMRYSLKYLASKYLKKNIQDNLSGHNSVEDATTCLELILQRIYFETLSISLMKGRDFYKVDFDVPCFPPASRKNCISGSTSRYPFRKPGPNTKSATNPNRFQPNGCKHVFFATPVFPIVPPVTPEIKCASNELSGSQDLPGKIDS